MGAKIANIIQNVLVFNNYPGEWCKIADASKDSRSTVSSHLEMHLMPLLFRAKGVTSAVCFLCQSPAQL